MNKQKSNLKAFGAGLLGMLVLAAGLLLVTSAQAGTSHKEKSQMKPDLVDTAVSAGSFTTLVTALKAADLVDTLKGKGPFTVFAPSDEAFRKLPAGTLEALLADKAKLTAVLTYHVVPGKVTAAEAKKLTSARTVNGQSLTLRVQDGAVLVDDARVVQADIAASNGVIHVIDSVILPKAQ